MFNELTSLKNCLSSGQQYKSQNMQSKKRNWTSKRMTILMT